VGFCFCLLVRCYVIVLGRPYCLFFTVCPVSRGPLIYDREANELISQKAGLAYPIRDGVPVLLADEARQLEADEQI